MVNSVDGTEATVTNGDITLQTFGINFNPAINLAGISGRRLYGTNTATEWDGELSISSVTSITNVNNPFAAVFSSDVKSMMLKKGTGGYNYYSDGNGAVDILSPVVPYGTPTIGQINYTQNNLTGSTGAVNDKLTGGPSTKVKISFPGSSFEIGGRTYNNSNGSVISGLVSEVIVYKDDYQDGTDANSINRRNITTYLAVKYGITLSADNDGDGTLGEAIGAVTEGDYLDSNDAVIWDYSAKTTYHNDIVGVGIDNGSALHQRISKSINTNTVLTVSTDTNFTNANITGGSGYADVTRSDANPAYVLLGNNSGATTLNPANTELGNGLTNRIDREWKVSKTSNFTSAVGLQFSGLTNPENLVVIQSDNEDFNVGTFN